MSKVIAIIGVFLCLAAWAAPVYGRRGRQGTLVVQLRVSHSHPPGHIGQARIKLLLVITTLPGRVVTGIEGDALSGHRFKYALPPGEYKVRAVTLPPIGNPISEPCATVPAAVRVHAGRSAEARVECHI